jgi:hypothetical protein
MLARKAVGRGEIESGGIWGILGMSLMSEG